MKKLICIVLSALLLFACGSAALAEDHASVIRVTGNATVALTADTATLQLGVNTRSENVRDGQSENARLINAVLDALYALGLGEKDVVTSQYSVYSMYEYSYDDMGREIRTPYFEVDNMLTVTVRDITQINAVLDAAIEAGANTTYGITFSSTKENEAYLQALTRAVEDAAKKAQVLADAAGKTLGDLILMDASQSDYYYGVSNTFDAKGAESGRTIVSGDVSVSANVTLEYSFR